MHQIVTIDFHNDTLFVAKRDDGEVVAISPICASLGLRPEKQAQRIKNDPILREGYAVVAFPSPGGPQEMFCLRVDLMNGWLFTIDESRVKDEETRQKVLTYKRECYAVLARRSLACERRRRAMSFLQHRSNIGLFQNGRWMRCGRSAKSSTLAACSSALQRGSGCGRSLGSPRHRRI